MLSDAQLAPLRADASRSPVGQQALASDPWQVVPAIAARLRDATIPTAFRNELQFAAALSLARLGLRTTALEALERCEHPAKAALIDLLAQLADDTLPISVLVRSLECNLAALPAMISGTLRTGVPAWLESLGRTRAFRTFSGATVLERDGAWTLFVDGPAVARLMEQGTPREGPFYFDGLHAPGAIQALFRVTERKTGEVQPRIVLMFGGVQEALTALCVEAIPGVLSSSRVELWCDAECPRLLRDEAASRLACTLGWVLTIPSPPNDGQRWATGEPARVLAAMGEKQRTQMLDVRRRIDDWEAGLNEAEREQRLRNWRDAKPSVFILTTRFSTYVQHAAEDLGESLQRMGCNAHVLKEPDDHSILASVGVLSAIDACRPDLILLINTVRSQLEASLPRGVPVVTWVQDAMPHLFDERTGRAMTDRDFLVGHLHPELFAQFAFPRRRTLSTPVLASEVKFHDRAVDDVARRKHTCDVVYISHQSETPDEFCGRVVAESSADSFAPRLLPHLAPLVVKAATSSGVVGQRLHDALHDATVTAFRGAMGADPPARVFSLALRTMTHPLAERAMRQQMLHWAADLCDARGWTLHLHGRGWEKHPRFGRYARGVLAHGEQLRAAYQCATVQLHAGLGGVHHQRLMECALSGGCTLVRVKPEDVRLLEWWAQNDVATHFDPVTLTRAFPDRDDYFLTPIADHWQAMLVQSLYDRLGVPPQHDRTGMLALHVDQIRDPWSHTGGTPMPFAAAWLAGDLESAGFWDRASFERVVSRVIESPARRESLVRWQQSAVRTHFSLGGMIEGVFRVVSDGLCASSPAPAAGPVPAMCR